MRYRARKEQATRLRAQLAEARLDALRRQLDPHFLFNTLHAVGRLRGAAEGRPAAESFASAQREARATAGCAVALGKYHLPLPR